MVIGYKIKVVVKTSYREGYCKMKRTMKLSMLLMMVVVLVGGCAKATDEVTIAQTDDKSSETTVTDEIVTIKLFTGKVETVDLMNFKKMQAMLLK